MCCESSPGHHHGHYGHPGMSDRGQCFCGCHSPRGFNPHQESKDSQIAGLAHQLENLKAQAVDMEQQIERLKQEQ